MNFTSSAAIQTSPPVSFDHYFGSENQRNRAEVLFHYSMQNFSGNIGRPTNEKIIRVYSSRSRPSRLLGIHAPAKSGWKYPAFSQARLTLSNPLTQLPTSHTFSTFQSRSQGKVVEFHLSTNYGTLNSKSKKQIGDAL